MTAYCSFISDCLLFIKSRGRPCVYSQWWVSHIRTYFIYHTVWTQQRSEKYVFWSSLEIFFKDTCVDFFLDKCLSPVVKDQTVYIFRLCCVWNWEPVFLLVIWWSLFAQTEFLSVWFKVMLVHPEKTLSGWWDVKIPKRTNQPFACFHLFFQTAGNRLSVFLIIQEQRLHHAPNRS